MDASANRKHQIYAIVLEKKKNKSLSFEVFPFWCDHDEHIKTYPLQNFHDI